MLPKNEMREMKILRFIVKLHILIIGWDGAGQWTLFHWLYIRGAGNNGEYFAAPWPGKIIAVIPSVGVNFLKLSKKFQKQPRETNI